MESGDIVALLKACAKQKDLQRGIGLHADIVKSRLLKESRYVGNNLINMYAKCGALATAQQVLDQLPVRDAVSWSALITGYAQHGQGEEALNCFNRMQWEGHSPDAVTLTCVLKACGGIGAAEKGEQIHDEVVRQGWLGKDIMLGNALVDMYSKCGVLAKARRVLDGLPIRNVVSWSALIAGYAQQGQGQEALNCFEQMQSEGLSPDAVTYICILTACASIGAVDKGEQIHEEIVRRRLLGKNVVLGTALVDMYTKCGAVAKACQVLDELTIRNVVSWSALIAGYVQQGQGEEALNCFERMQQEGLSPNAITFSCAVKACASLQAGDKGEYFHDEIVRQGLLGKNLVLGNNLVDMYTKCGELAKARQVLHHLPVRDVVSWSALIAGYAQLGQGEEALNCLEWMQSEGLSPNAVTFSCILKACASIGAADKGEQIHNEIVRHGELETNLILGTALVDMYAKCGALEKARWVFDELPVHDVVSWNALIAGYVQLGQSGEALNCFSKMQCEGLAPVSGTFVCLLNACSHSGLLDEGQMFFVKMSTNYAITPDVEHFCCMVDLFGRAGDFNKALEVIMKMPSGDYLPVWHALLGACHKWGNVELGRLAFEHAVQVEKNDAAAYICMANIFSAVGMHEDADKIDVMRVKNKGWDNSGFR